MSEEERQKLLSQLNENMVPDRGKPNFFQKLLQSDAYWENVDLIDRTINEFGYYNLEKGNLDILGLLTRDERIPADDKRYKTIKSGGHENKPSKEYPKKPDYEFKGPSGLDIIKWLVQDKVSRPKQIGDTNWGMNLFFDQPMPGYTREASEEFPPILKIPLSLADWSVILNQAEKVHFVLVVAVPFVRSNLVLAMIN